MHKDREKKIAKYGRKAQSFALSITGPQHNNPAIQGIYYWAVVSALRWIYLAVPNKLLEFSARKHLSQFAILLHKISENTAS